MVNDYGLRKGRIAKPVDPTLRPRKGKLAECWACPSLWVNYYSNKMEKVERKEIGGGSWSYLEHQQSSLYQAIKEFKLPILG